MEIPDAKHLQASVTKPSPPDREVLLELERVDFAKALEKAVKEDKNSFRYIARCRDEELFEEFLLEVKDWGYYVETVPVRDRRYKDGIRGWLAFQRDIYIHTPDHVLQVRARVEKQKLEDFRRWRAAQEAQRGSALPPDPATLLPTASELAASEQERQDGIQLKLGCLFLFLLPLVIWGWVTLLNQS